MKKIALALVISLSLGGCAAFQKIESVLSIGTASIANPVTPDKLNDVESAAILVFTGLKAWKTSCVQGLIPASCKSQIAAVQVYTVQIPPYLTQLRTFVKTNDQVNAVVVYNNITALITTVKTQAAANGVTIAPGS